MAHALAPAAPAPVEWQEARAGLAEVGTRLAELVSAIRKPDAVALGKWTTADVAAHLSHGFWAFCQLARGSQPMLDDVHDLDALSGAMLRDDEERSPRALARRVDEAVTDFLETTAGVDGQEVRPWMVKDTQLTVAALACEMVSEALVHGYDIARADERPWTIEPSYARLAIQGFLVPALRALDPRALVDQRAAAGVRAVYDLRFRGGYRVFFVFDDGELSVEAPSAEHRPDCHISADPTAFLLVAWGRRSQWAPVLRGQLVAWGRRPWLGLKLRSLLRNV